VSTVHETVRPGARRWRAMIEAHGLSKRHGAQPGTITGYHAAGSAVVGATVLLVRRDA